MKKKISIVCLLMAIFLSLTFGFSSANADERYVYLGGMPAGFSISTKGAHIVGLCDVITEQGLESPAKDAGIQVGDVILKICNFDINNAKDIENTVISNAVTDIKIKRDGEILDKTIKPSKDLSGKFKLGVFIKDSISGIGTITYIDDNRFASLGHAVIGDNGDVLSILGGDLYNCNITGVIKGERGKAGELRGVFLRDKPIASIEKNLVCGVYGCLNGEYNLSGLEKIAIGDAKMGDAVIYTTIDGSKPIQYNISIVKNENYTETKNFVIEVKDEKLLNTTGGIVQGMSGSPIVQDGKLVGAVTHVFINDPTRGFGISINNMINN